jgi:hypothetical protein
VERAVAADDYEQLRTVVDRPARELGQVTRRLREERVADEAFAGRDVSDLRPPLARRPVRRRGIDQEDRVLRQRR